MQGISVQKVGVYTGHKDSIYTLEKGISDTVFYTSGADGMIVSWDLTVPEDGLLLATLPNSVYALHFDSESKELFVGHNFEGIHVIDTVTNIEKRSAQITKSAIFDIKKVNDWLLVVTGDGYLIVLQASDLSVLAKLKITDASIRTIALHPGQKQLALGGSDHLIRILDLPSLHIVKTLSGHENSIFTLCYSPSGDVLISAGRDAQIKVWDTILLTESNSIAAHMYAINHIAFSPSGKYFVTASMDKSIKVWDAVQFKLLKVIDKSRHAGHATSINKLLWSPCNNSIISVSDDRTISVWNVDLPQAVN